MLFLGRGGRLEGVEWISYFHKNFVNSKRLGGGQEQGQGRTTEREQVRTELISPQIGVEFSPPPRDCVSHIYAAVYLVRDLRD